MAMYKCDGECGGESDQPGTCQSPTCSKFGQPLTEHTDQETSADSMAAAEPTPVESTPQPESDMNDMSSEPSSDVAPAPEVPAMGSEEPAPTTEAPVESAPSEDEKTN